MLCRTKLNSIPSLSTIVMVAVLPWGKLAAGVATTLNCSVPSTIPSLMIV